MWSPPLISGNLVDIIKNLSAILGGAVSAIIGFYFGQRTTEKNCKSGDAGAPGAGGTVGGGPTIVGTVPSDRSHPVPRSTLLSQQTFSEPVSVEPSSSLTLKDINNKLVEGKTCPSPDGKTLEFKSSGLAGSTTYIAAISGVKDLRGNIIRTKTWKFTTA